MFSAKIMGREALTQRLTDLVPDVEDKARQAKLDVAQEAARQIASVAPVDTGEYRSEIVGGLQKDHAGSSSFSSKTSKDPDASGVFGPFIWRFLEFGARPHVEKAKSASVLAFEGRGGKDEFAGAVHHPGMQAHPHIFPTWRAYRAKAKRKVAAAVNKAVRTAMKKA